MSGRYLCHSCVLVPSSFLLKPQAKVFPSSKAEIPVSAAPSRGAHRITPWMPSRIPRSGRNGDGEVGKAHKGWDWSSEDERDEWYCDERGTSEQPRWTRGKKHRRKKPWDKQVSKDKVECARSVLAHWGRAELTLLLQASSHLISSYWKGIHDCFPGVHVQPCLHKQDTGTNEVFTV